eukprot:Nitzschia sp. Nitz4//scaffold308_size21609//3580//5124//NITZ4_008601-RA/size21609-augustus-gene-0.41-mRNA-1//1//CDS//3329547149//3428//frame0
MFSASAQRFTKKMVLQKGTYLATLTNPAVPMRSLSAVNLHFNRNFSTAHPGPETAFIERPLKALDLAAVRQIKAELMEVDKDSNGRLDSDELKQLLSKHMDVFTDREIVELGELYYAAKAGGSVRFDNFIEAVDRVAQRSPQAAAAGVSAEDKAVHFREGQQHPLGIGRDGVEFFNLGNAHGHYTAEELDVKLTHVAPKDGIDKLAWNAVQAVRYVFDSFTGWRNDVSKITATNVLHRVIYLETIAAVPGMVAAIVRHFRSLRNMKADGGYMQLFLEEANNERMHLLTFVGMRDPNLLFRAAVILGQFGFGAAFTAAYIISPAFCHRFVGYVEEEACSTYTKIIKAIEIAPEGSELAKWRTEAPPAIAVAYWHLGPDGTVLDLMKAVRADEAEHRDVNHLISGVKEGQVNPLYDPESKLDLMLTKYVQAVMTTKA